MPATHCCCPERRYHHLDEDAGSLTAADVLPQPVVVRHTMQQCHHLRLKTMKEEVFLSAVQRLLHAQGDLNGDGEPEIIVATHEAKLRVRRGGGAAAGSAAAALSFGHSPAARFGAWPYADMLLHAAPTELGLMAHRLLHYSQHLPS